MANPQPPKLSTELKDEEMDVLLDEIHGVQVPAPSSALDTAVDWDEIVKAVQTHNTAPIKKKIASGDIGIDAQNPRNGKTLLMYATIVGDLDLVTTVCNFGADVTVKDDDDKDALQYALAYGRYKITELVFYRTLSGSLGRDLKEIAQVLHQRGKEVQYMMDAHYYFLVVKDIHELMIKAMKERAVFDEAMLFYAWHYAAKATEYENQKKGLQSELWRTMMKTYESILGNTDDKQGWQWLKQYFLPSLIWHLPHPDNEDDGDDNKDNDDNNNNESLDATLKKTLFWELLHRVRAETQKQSELLLKAKIDGIKQESADDWLALTSFDVAPGVAVDARGVRQDTCGCLSPQYTESELSETRYPPSTHFSAKRHYDTKLYLNDLLFRGNILDADFQAAVKRASKAIADEIGVKCSYRAGPVKTLTRCQAKVENEYIAEAWPTSAKLLDINRCSLKLASVKDLLKFLHHFVAKVGQGGVATITQIVRCKNGWQEYDEAHPAYTDVKLNCLVCSPTDSSVKIVAEIQFLLDLMSSFKKKAHKLYAVERKFELVYNYEKNVRQAMSKFRDVDTDAHAVVKHLVANDDAQSLALLRDNTHDLLAVLAEASNVGLSNVAATDHVLICALSDPSGKYHEFFMRHKQRYMESVLSIVNRQNAGPKLLEQHGTDATRLCFVQRLVHVLTGKPVAADDDSLEVAVGKLRALNVIKGLFDTDIRRYVSDGHVRAPANECLDFEFGKRTRIKFVQLQSETFVFGHKHGNTPRAMDPDTGGEEMVRVAVGYEHTLALDAVGNVFAWGNGGNGQLGLGGEETLETPQRLPTFCEFRVVAVAAGQLHSLVLTEDGSVWSFGWTAFGQLGHDYDNDEYSPNRIEALSKQAVRVVDISAGASHSGAVASDGKLFMFGDNRDGRCGVNPKDRREVLEPTAVAFGRQSVEAAKVECGWGHTLVLTRNGQVFSFGWGAHVQLGHGDEEDNHVAKRIESLSAKTVVDIAAGYGHSMCATADGELYSWGRNDYGQLGHGDIDRQLTPKKVEFFAKMKVIGCECGGWHSCAITDTQQVFMFGKNDEGQLGIGSMDKEPHPLPVKLDAIGGGDERIVCVSLYGKRSAVITTSKQAVLSDGGDGVADAKENEQDSRAVEEFPLGEQRPLVLLPKKRVLAVNIRNETIFGCDDWLLLSHEQTSSVTIK
mmetsp:Transcript_38958/g.63691  ORF Transcript_38958/g.63691 Transcript_38958/m.63691 type:complete len:1180 (+) Transcript_38958:2-3541(+)